MKPRYGLLLILPLLLAGCSHDAAQLTVVTGIGVDGQLGQYQVGTEVVRLTDEKEGGQSVYLSGDGLTITDSIDKMVSMTGRSLYCNHAQVLLISRKTAQNGILELLDEILRGNEYPLSLRLAITKTAAAKAMQAKPVVSDLHSVELEDMIREGAAQCLNPDMDLCGFYEDVAAPGIEGILPFMELKENGGEQVCAIAGTALFVGDQMESVLNEKDSESLMWMRGKHGGTLATEHAVFEVVSLERKLTAGQHGGQLHLKMTLKASNNEENKEKLMQEAEREMKARCESLLKRLQFLKCDAIGFGSQIYQTQPKVWKGLQEHWPDHFSKYPISVTVEIGNMIWGRVWSESGQQTLEGMQHGS